MRAAKCAVRRLALVPPLPSAGGKTMSSCRALLTRCVYNLSVSVDIYLRIHRMCGNRRTWWGQQQKKKKKFQVPIYIPLDRWQLITLLAFTTRRWVKDAIKMMEMTPNLVLWGNIYIYLINIYQVNTRIVDTRWNHKTGRSRKRCHVQAILSALTGTQSSFALCNAVDEGLVASLFLLRLQCEDNTLWSDDYKTS